DAVGVSRLEASPAPQPSGNVAGDQASRTGGQQATTGADGDVGSVVSAPSGTAGTIGLLAAAALGALAFERRRRIGADARPAAEVEEHLRGRATPSRAAFLDRALRDLASSCRAAGVALPAVYAVELADE